MLRTTRGHSFFPAVHGLLISVIALNISYIGHLWVTYMCIFGAAALTDPFIWVAIVQIRWKRLVELLRYLTAISYALLIFIQVSCKHPWSYLSLTIYVKERITPLLLGFPTERDDKEY